MSFLRKLFGGGGDEPAAPEASEEYEGFQIVAAPTGQGGQYRLEGRIERQVEGELRVHHLIRADLFQSLDEATQFTIRKAKQVIDEQGDRLFD